MAKRLTYDFISKELRENDLYLINTSRESGRLIITFKCSNNHVITERWDKWKLSKRCPKCYGRGKPTIEYIRKSFRDKSCTLLSNEYVSSVSPLSYVDSIGNTCETSWNFWVNNKVDMFEKKVDYTVVSGYFAAEGYKLLSTSYINTTTKLYYICSNGHQHSVTWKDWKMGNRCPYCSNKIKKTIEEIRELFEKEDYELLTTEYVNAYSYLDYVCPEGHRHRLRWYNWQNGHRCPICAGQNSATIEQVRKSFNKEGYTLVSDVFINNKVKLQYICPEGHRHSISWLKWCQGRRCRKCSFIQRGLNLLGPGSPNWRGGISFEPYCEAWQDKEYKQDIRDRDNNICLNPYCDSPDKNDLAIHHINYIKKDCRPSNLITVCRSCNSRANTDRKWHESWYHAIMFRRYNYNY